MSELADQKCVPCRGAVLALAEEDVKRLLEKLNGWQAVDNKRLSKSFRFADFMGAMQLANRIATLAEEQGHHPDLLVRWGELRIELWTHKIDGLTESDFVLAAKIDRAAAHPLSGG